mgnify:CR=1 FL=1
MQSYFLRQIVCVHLCVHVCVQVHVKVPWNNGFLETIIEIAMQTLIKEKIPIKSELKSHNITAYNSEANFTALVKQKNWWTHSNWSHVPSKWDS